MTLRCGRRQIDLTGKVSHASRVKMMMATGSMISRHCRRGMAAAMQRAMQQQSERRHKGKARRNSPNNPILGASHSTGIPAGTTLNL